MHTRSSPTHQLMIAVGVIMTVMTMTAQTPWPALAEAAGSLEASAATPDGDLMVKIVDPECKRSGEPDQYLYPSLDEAVKDTIPGEWWPPTGYSAPMVNGALKSASIIIRTRIQYHRDIWRPYADAAYATANVDWPGFQQLPIGCTEWQMNTILPKSINSNEGGSHWGNASDYQSNSATVATTGKVIVRETGSVIVTEWNPAVENRSVVCNYNSRDWGYCAINALAEYLNSPWGHNQLARRLNTTPMGRVEFKAQAYNAKIDRSGHYWQLFTDGYMQALPNNGAGYGSNGGYQYYSPDMSFMVPFPQSGSFFVCVYGQGGTPNDDSLHVGIDDNNDGVADATTALDMTDSWHNASWLWGNRQIGGNYATVQVSGSAFHRMRIWMREDGMKVDKMILSTSSSCPP